MGTFVRPEHPAKSSKIENPEYWNRNTCKSGAENLGFCTQLCYYLCM